jgi:putative ABC transport system permease protein
VKRVNIVRLYPARVGRTLVPELLALAGITLGVALLYSSQVAAGSLTGSVTHLPGTLAAMRLQVIARSPEGVPAEPLLARVQALPGVRQAAPVLQVPALAIGARAARPVELVGVEPSAVKLNSPYLRRVTPAQLAHIEAVAIPEALAHAIGARTFGPLEIELRGLRRTVQVGLEVRASESALFASSSLVIAPLRYAQQLAAASTISSILVAPEPGREAAVRGALRRLVAGAALEVRSTASELSLFEQAAGPLSQADALLAVVSATVGLLFALFAMLLTAPRRRRWILDLRAAGYSSREVCEVLLFDALVLGTAAALLGLALGEVVSRTLLGSNAGYLVFAFAVANGRVVSLQDVAVTVAVAILAALVGTFAPQRRAVFAPFRLNVQPRRARRYRRGPQLACAAACLALAGWVTAFAQRLALVGLAALGLATVLLLPPAFDAVVAALGRVFGRIVAEVPQLGLLGLRHRSGRVLSLTIATTGAVAVAGSVAISGAHSNLQRGLESSASAVNAYAQVWVLPSASYDLFTTAPIDVRANLSRRLTRLPGVDSLSLYRGGFVDWGARRVWLLAPPAQTAEPLSAAQILSGNAALATRRLRQGGWAVVSATLAAEHHLRIGGPVALPSVRPLRLRLAAIATNLGWPPGAVIINGGDYARGWDTRAPSALLVDVARYSSPSRVAAEIRRTLGPASGLTVETSRQRERRELAVSRAALAQLGRIAAIVLGAAVLAMAGATWTVIYQRRRRLAILKTEGFDRLVLWRALLWETAVLLGTGCLIGAIAGIYGQWMLSRALQRVTGFPVVSSAAGATAALTFAAVTLAALLIVAGPGYGIARVKPSSLFGGGAPRAPQAS